MLYYVNLIFVVLAVSVDSFAVGITYGLRKIRIPFVAVSIIMFCSGAIIVLSMSFGHLFTFILPPSLTGKLGGIVFISIGLFLLYSMIGSELQSDRLATNEHHVKNQNGFSRIRAILKRPEQADKDKSGSISYKEAILLGTALALDAFGAGIGAALLGYSILNTAGLIAVMSGLFIFLGSKIGTLLARYKPLRKLTYLPPLILITIGVYNLF